MTKADFSHLIHTPKVVVHALDHGYKVEDENWLGTVQRLDPPLFDHAELADLEHILDPEVERRGGKSIGVLSDVLIARLRRVERPDLHACFIDGLIARLASGKRYTRQDSAREYGKRRRKPERDRMIVYFYDFIYENLEGNPERIDHEAFEAISVSSQGSNRGQRAIATLHDFLRERTTINPPSQETLLNIVSEAPNRKRRPRS